PGALDVRRDVVERLLRTGGVGLLQRVGGGVEVAAERGVVHLPRGLAQVAGERLPGVGRELGRVLPGVAQRVARARVIAGADVVGGLPRRGVVLQGARDRVEVVLALRRRLAGAGLIGPGALALLPRAVAAAPGVAARLRAGAAIAPDARERRAGATARDGRALAMSAAPSASVVSATRRNGTSDTERWATTRKASPTSTTASASHRLRKPRIPARCRQMAARSASSWSRIAGRRSARPMS